MQSRICDFINGGPGDFEQLAMEVFEFQRERNPIYRAFCDRQPKPTHWKEIPAVPTSAFKDFPIACFPIEEAVAVFHTSGTTREKAGKHYFKTLELYEAASKPNFQQHLLNNEARLHMLILMANRIVAPHSSLASMLDLLRDRFGVTGSMNLYVDSTEPEVARSWLKFLVSRLTDAESDRQPVFLLGTAFSFMHLFDWCETNKRQVCLAEGSRAMETGGFKGRSREVTKRELHGLFKKFLGVPPSRIVNEYGMTELSTQFYDETLRVGHQSDLKDVPHWSRILIIDPMTGKEAQPGERGLIRVFDLANLWSAMCIQTEDLGIAHADGRFEVLGRTAGAEVRGCSLNAESFPTK